MHHVWIVHEVRLVVLAILRCWLGCLLGHRLGRVLGGLLRCLGMLHLNRDLLWSWSILVVVWAWACVSWDSLL